MLSTDMFVLSEMVGSASSLYNRSDNRLEDSTDKWVVNISSKPLSDLDEKAWSHGFKFAITLKSVPVAEIISSVESGIKHLPPESANLIRAKTTSCYRNMVKDELETLKRLSKDALVTILPADKGCAVVMMDSSDHQQKINGLLQDFRSTQEPHS